MDGRYFIGWKITEDTLKVTMNFHPDHSEHQMKTMQQGLLSQIEAVGWKGNVECSITVEEESAPKINNQKIPFEE